jgi:hypothetical protein
MVLVLVGNEAARLVGWNLAVLGALGVVAGAVSHAAKCGSHCASARRPRRPRRPRERGL